MYTSVIATYIPIYDEVASIWLLLNVFQKTVACTEAAFHSWSKCFLSFLRSAGEVL